MPVTARLAAPHLPDAKGLSTVFHARGHANTAQRALQDSIREGHLTPHPAGGIHLHDEGQGILLRSGADWIDLPHGTGCWAWGVGQASSSHQPTFLILGRSEGQGFHAHPNIFARDLRLCIRDGGFAAFDPRPWMAQVQGLTVGFTRDRVVRKGAIIPHWALATLPSLRFPPQTAQTWGRLGTALLGAFLAHVDHPDDAAGVCIRIQAPCTEYGTLSWMPDPCRFPMRTESHHAKAMEAVQHFARKVLDDPLFPIHPIDAMGKGAFTGKSPRLPTLAHAPTSRHAALHAIAFWHKAHQADAKGLRALLGVPSSPAC